MEAAAVGLAAASGPYGHDSDSGTGVWMARVAEVWPLLTWAEVAAPYG